MSTDKTQGNEQFFANLKSSSAITRRNAINDLSLLIVDDASARQAIEALFEYLENKDPVELESWYISGELADEADNTDVLRAVSSKLQALGPQLAVIYPQAFDRLFALFQQGDLLSAPEVAEILGSLRDTRALPALIAALQDENIRVVETSAAALGRIGDEQAVEPLLEALQNVAQSQDVPGFAAAVSRIVQALDRFKDTRAVEPLLQILEQMWVKRSFHQKVFVDIVQTLVRLRAYAAADLFVSMLQTPEPRMLSYIKACIVNALLDLNVSHAHELIVTSLVADLESSSLYDRAQAAHLLGKSRAVEAIGSLLVHLNDKAPLRRDIYSATGWVDNAARVRANVAEALGKLGAMEAVEPLIACLQDPDWSVQSHAARALGDLGTAQAIEPLLRSLEKGAWQARKDCVEALGKLGAVEAIEPLMAYLQQKKYPDTALQAACVEALGRLGAVEALDVIIACLQGKDPYLRFVAVKALGMLGDARAIEPLTITLHDPLEYVRQQAQAELHKLGVLNNE